MTDFNPLAGAILGSAQAQQQAALHKQRQLRRAQNVRKDSASADQPLEHQVESAEESIPVHDEQKQRSPRRDTPGKPPEDSEDEPRPRLDLTA